jgi:lipopolysaccharide export system protein LptA
MKKPFSLFSLVSLFLVAMLAGGMAHAEKADSAKPMNIEADALRHDDLKQISVFTGNVVVTKGTIILRGAQLEVRQDAQGYQFGVMTAEPGKRAFFRQKRDTALGAPDEFVEGEGEVIDYDGRADIVKFIRRAELRRYMGGTLADQLNGDLIVYNNLTGIFTVDGNPANASAANPGGRVRAILAPRNAASAPVAPAAAASAPGLRSSTVLGGERK